MNQQIIENNGEHLPSKIQVPRDPVRKVSKSLQHNSLSQAEPSPTKTRLSSTDILGLSWVLFEDEHEEDY